MTRRLVVLVVDDDPHLRAAHCVLVDAMGHTPIAAADGREALELVEVREIDVVITDLCMPTMGGLDLIAGIRRMANRRQPYVVMVTSTPGAVSGDDREKLQIRAVISKPTTRSDIATHLSLALREMGSE